ncbi:hypothetical protein [Roseiconus lacunae]|uniref:hypothetical protein n=1 Tax=Roseiconus lacunae TaxID=2605694 RepID=UPI0011F1868C|nr:hypothetical protein [Roseiconus lacunae]
MRRDELTANALLYFPIIMMLGMLLVTSYPLNIAAILVLYLIGMIDLTYAKLPLFRHRIWNSFGPKHIPTKRRDAYFRGYKRIAFGAALNLLTLMHYSLTTSGL